MILKVNFIKNIAFILCLIIPLNSSDIKIEHNIKAHLKPKKEKIKKKKSFKYKSFDHFLWALAQRESGNDWTIYNKWGYMGKYQFGEIAIEELGYSNCFTFKEFKKNPEVFPEWLQDELIIKYININKRNLGSYIKKYNGDTIDSVYITESGILAAAHLVGSGSTVKWLSDSAHIDITDGNGISIKHYLSLFSGYNIP